MYTLWLLTLALLLLVNQAATQCDEGWKFDNNSCWFVSNSGPLSDLSWQASRDYCLQHGGELASLHSQEDQDFILTMAEELEYSGDMWIGLNQLTDRNSAHKWSDGTLLGYEAYAPDQPSTDGDEKCIYSKQQQQGACYERLQGISTVDGIISDPPAPPLGCERLYIPNGDWQECENRCTVSTTCHAYTYFSLEHPESLWKGECLTCSEEVVGDNRVPNEYATSGIKETCDDTKAEYWYSTNCGYEKGFVCKKDPASDLPATVPPTPRVPGYCPRGYFGTRNKCYKLFPHQYPAGISWEEARQSCKEEPGIEPDLASITNIEEQAVVSASLTNHSWGYWIAYRKISNKWLWADNSNPDAFTNWAPNVGYLDCAEVQTYPQPHGTWSTLGCNDKRGYICQTYKDEDNIIQTSSPGSSNNCPSGFISYWYGCYKLEVVPRAFSDAKSHCNALQGSHLVSIHDEAENAAIFAFADRNFPLWLGLEKYEDEYQWVDGWPELFTKWGPDGPANGEGCVAMVTDSTWNDTICNNQHAFMCKYTEVAAPTTPSFVDGVCPGDEWEEWGAHCFHFSSDVLSWDAAGETCRAKGAGWNGELASVHNRVTNEWIYSKLKADEIYVQDGAWIGLKQDGLASPWYWIDGSAVNYMTWAPGEPNDKDGTNICVEMYTKSWPGLWNDHGCWELRPFVCMAEKGDPPTTPTMPPQGPGDCPSGEWFHYGDLCFLFRPDEYDDWEQAQGKCLKEGGGATLVSIRTDAENRFIVDKLKEITNMPVERNSWIGLVQTDANDNTKYHWYDRTPFEYSNWAPGQPDSASDRCVDIATSDGKWRDTGCAVLAGYVCIYSKGTTSLSTGSSAGSTSFGSTSNGSSHTPTPSPSPTDLDPNPGGDGLSGGAITGIVFGVLLGSAVLAVAGYFGFVFYKRRQLPALPKMSYDNKTYTNMN